VQHDRRLLGAGVHSPSPSSLAGDVPP
jgi:hypothetical protein